MSTDDLPPGLRDSSTRLVEQIRAARDEYPGAAWTDEIPTLEHAIERFIERKAN